MGMNHLDRLRLILFFGNRVEACQQTSRSSHGHPSENRIREKRF
jgi:hypothetical protein